MKRLIVIEFAINPCNVRGDQRGQILIRQHVDPDTCEVVYIEHEYRATPNMKRALYSFATIGPLRSYTRVTDKS